MLFSGLAKPFKFSLARSWKQNFHYFAVVHCSNYSAVVAENVACPPTSPRLNVPSSSCRDHLVLDVAAGTEAAAHAVITDQVRCAVTGRGSCEAAVVAGGNQLVFYAGSYPFNNAIVAHL